MQIPLLLDCLMSLLVTKCCIFLLPSKVSVVFFLHLLVALLLCTSYLILSFPLFVSASFIRSTIVCFYFLFCLAHDRNRQVNMRCIRIVWYIWGSCLNDMMLSKHDLPENFTFIRRSVVHAKFQMHCTDFFSSFD